MGAGSEVDWGRVVLWWGDERFVAPDSPDRNAGQARAAFADRLAFDPAKVHEVPSTADSSSVEDAAAAYSAQLREHGAGSFEVLMLGVGPDGHVASLFPGSPQLDADDQVAVGVTASPKPPPERVSLTFGALNRSRSVWFLVSGEGKAGAVARALTPAPTSTRSRPPVSPARPRPSGSWTASRRPSSNRLGSSSPRNRSESARSRIRNAPSRRLFIRHPQTSRRLHAVSAFPCQV